MSKFKAAKKKSDTPLPPQMRPGLPCLVIVIFIVIAITVLIFLGLKNG